MAGTSTLEKVPNETRAKKLRTSLSANLVAMLKSRHMSYVQIGELLGVHKSFISQVASSKKNFTIDHLVQLEQKLGEPLPILLLKATQKEKLSEGMKHLYNKALQVFNESEIKGS
jgi:predicted XRE-type DNA-binding protein